MDLIDRQAVINKICDTKCFIGRKFCTHLEPCEDIRIIESVPTVEPKRAEWVEEREVERGITTFTLVKCSCCGQWALKKIHNAIQNLGEATLNYCPNCGADMRGENK